MVDYEAQLQATQARLHNAKMGLAVKQFGEMNASQLVDYMVAHGNEDDGKFLHFYLAKCASPALRDAFLDEVERRGKSSGQSKLETSIQ